MFWGFRWTYYSSERRAVKVHDIEYLTFTLSLNFSWTLAGVVSGNSYLCYNLHL